MRDALAAAVFLCLAACREEPAAPPAAERPPSILLVIWDTVRADHLGVYGYPRATTPFLESFAREARVYEDCRSVAPTTVPAHAAMFTGWMPGEHGATNENRRFSEEEDTLAELLRAAGYRTFLYSANPHVSRRSALVQGFDRVEHPWSEKLEAVALPMLAEHLGYRGGVEALRARLEDSGSSSWALSCIGALAGQRLAAWLEESDPARPFLAVLNYMEAHTPLVPGRSAREQLLGAEEVQESYRLDLPWDEVWSFSLGLSELDPAVLRAQTSRYDAALVELDRHFRGLIELLEARGELDHTVVVLTADHGEHLGEHHLLDHQFSLHEELLHVPLLLRYPPRIAAGRDAGAVMNFDLFPTLLELAGLEPPAGRRARSLLGPVSARLRVAETHERAFQVLAPVVERFPDFDPRPHQETQRALYAGDLKLIAREAGLPSLYDLSADPREEEDLAARAPAQAAELGRQLESLVATFRPAPQAGAPAPLAEEEEALLRQLGYGAARDD